MSMDLKAVRTAAERVLAKSETVVVGEPYTLAQRSGKWCAAAEALARFALSLTDETPITEEWLKAMGFVYSIEARGYCLGLLDVTGAFPCGWQVAVNGGAPVHFAPDMTRGQLTMLLHALGISTK